MKNYIKKLQQQSDLTVEETKDMISDFMSGSATDTEISSALTALSIKGENADEIYGAAQVMRDKACTINAPIGAVDCCGTGGDGIGTYNISTAVAFICAACGIPMAKHGNRSASSKSGAADTLEALGINLDIPHDRIEKALKQIGFAFLMAPNHHKAMKYVAHIRKNLGFRTIFNILGPLANPAATKHQLIGVYDHKYAKPIAEALNNLGTKRAWIVHGKDGLDEITTTTTTLVTELNNGSITEFEIKPTDLNINLSKTEDLKGGNAEENAKALIELLNGKKNAYRDISILNSAAVLVISGITSELREGIKIASQAIDNKSALKVMETYKSFSNERV